MKNEIIFTLYLVRMLFIYRTEQKKMNQVASLVEVGQILEETAKMERWFDQKCDELGFPDRKLNR